MNRSPVVDSLWPLLPAMDLGLATSDAAVLRELQSNSLDEIFAPLHIQDRQAAAACLAGLNLLLNDVEGAHKIAQDLATPEGSYWHAIVHRRDGDFWNAKYWLRKVGRHPVLEKIAAAIRRQIEPIELMSNCIRQGLWDPSAFVDIVERRDSSEPLRTRLLARVQECEWIILFDYCWQEAIAAQQ